MLILVLDEQIYHMQNLTMDLENLSLKFIITEGHIFLQKNWLIYKKNRKSGQEVIYSSKCFNPNYTELVGYETWGN